MKKHWAVWLGLALALLLSVAGLVVSGILLQHHLVVEVGGDPLFNNICEVTENTSCDEVLASEWGEFEWGRGEGRISIPTAMLGFFFFAAMVSWFVVVGRPLGSRRRLHALPVLATAAGTAGCVFLDYVMFTQLDKWCPFCFAAHVIAALLFIMTLLLWPRRAAAVARPGRPVAPGFPPPVHQRLERMSPAPTAAHPSFHLIVVAILLAAATSAAAWSAYHRQLQKAYANEYFDRWQEYENQYEAACDKFLAGKQLHIPISTEDPVYGPVDAPHTVVVFTDFQCPYCRVLQKSLYDRFQENPGLFRIVFKYFPMNTTCNKHITRTLYKGACAAVVTAEAARLVGGNEAFWKMHDELFDKPKEFARQSTEFVQAATQRIGVDHDQLWRYIRTTSIWNRIRENVDQGHAVGVKGTPTMFFDGRKMDKWGDANFWRYLLRQEATPPEPTPPPATGPASPPTTQPASQPADT